MARGDGGKTVCQNKEDGEEFLHRLGEVTRNRKLEKRKHALKSL
jgi:hypothetical protein